MATAKDPRTDAQKDEFWINQCIKLAEKAELINDVPVGALVVCNDQMIAQAFNRKEIDQNPIAHAEILALQEASRNLNRWRLNDCTLYVTLEPCIMCAGAIVSSRIGRVVYATQDPKAGAIESQYNVLKDGKLNHQLDDQEHYCQEEASKQLKDFFSGLRKEKTSPEMTL